MTSKMKEWLHDRGLTLLQVSKRAGIIIPRDCYKMLSGRKKFDPKLKTTLIRVYGMTEKEFQEAVPCELLG